VSASQITAGTQATLSIVSYDQYGNQLSYDSALFTSTKAAMNLLYEFENSGTFVTSSSVLQLDSDNKGLYFK